MKHGANKTLVVEILPKECGEGLLRTKKGNMAQSTPIHKCIALTKLCNLDYVQSDYMSPYVGDKKKLPYKRLHPAAFRAQFFGSEPTGPMLAQ